MGSAERQNECFALSPFVLELTLIIHLDAGSSVFPLGLLVGGLGLVRVRAP